MITRTLALTLLLTCSGIAAEWQNISDSVVAQVKPGSFGPASGVVLDRTNGTVFIVVNDQGLWRSTDHGETFTRCDTNKAIGGRCETGWGLQMDPAGSRLACFMIYGSSAMTTDGGETWTKFKVSHLDFGAVDWADTGKRLLAIRHESGGMLTTSDDGGANWTDLDKGFSGCGVVDHATFVATKAKEPGIFRSTDSGATWTQVSDFAPSAGVPVFFKGALYWPTGKGIVVSRDGGATWDNLGEPVEATHGPYFGRSATEMVVVGKSGFKGSIDGGKTWLAGEALPPTFTVNRVGPHFAWDATANLFYASGMGKPALKLERGK